MTDLAETTNGSGPPDRLRRPGEAGFCVTCHTPLPNKVAWYCDEHRPAKRQRQATAGPREPQRLDSAPTPAARGGRASFAKVSDDNASRTLARLTIILLVIVMHYRLRHAGIRDQTGQLAEELSPTNAEAMSMVGPLARWGNSTTVGARVIAPIARNSDVIDCAYGWYEYNRRVSAFFDEHSRRLAPVRPIRVETGQPEGPYMPAAEQVVGPETPIAPAEVMGVAPPLTFGPDGKIAGT